MRKRLVEKEEAKNLRKLGYTYKDIVRELGVSKSSVSLWLRDFPLNEDERSFLRQRRDANISRGKIQAAMVLHQKRMERDKILFREATNSFEKYRGNPAFFLGLALYWAEGSKRNSGFAFTNSDPTMMCVMIHWIEEFLYFPKEILSARLYIHPPYAHEQLEKYWSKTTGIPLRNFRRTIYKPTGLLIKKRPNYKGCLRIETGHSTVTLRKVLFWQSMLIKRCRSQKMRP